MKPKLSIGLPVYNGEKYLSLAMESILAQTFGDFELIISDNASTDGTVEIIHRFLKADTRVKYFRNEQNIGASRNFNAVLTYAQGQYFKWASYDDLLASTYAEECVKLLQEDEDVVLTHARSREIDEKGDFIAAYDQYDAMRLKSKTPAHRFYDLISIQHSCDLVFGVTRTDILRKTCQIGSFPASDRVLLAELALRGQIAICPQYLFYHREHAENTWNLWKKDPSRVVWYDTTIKRANPYQHWKLYKEFSAAVFRVNLPIKDRFFCIFQLIRWPRAYWQGVRVWRLLASDISYALKN
jgi:glycosyltransferase involved in cell wall biosynthesis